MIRDPELIKTVTIKEFSSFSDGTDFDKSLDPVWEKKLFAVQGTRWKNLRQTLSPVFTSRKMKAMYVLMEDCEQRNLNSKNEAIIELELVDLVKRFLMNVIATTAFGLEINSVTDQNNEFYRIGTELTDFSGLKRFKFLFYKNMNSYLAKLLNMQMVSSNVSHYFHSIMKNTIDARVKNNIFRPDLVHLLMEARKGRLHLDESSDYSTTTDPSTVSSEKQFALSLTDEDITAQAVIFIFRGYDTTAKLLAFCSYELAVNPTIQERLREEVDTNSQKFNGKIGYEELFAMKYLDMVISGSRYAIMAAKLFLFHLLANFDIVPTRKSKIPLEICKNNILLLPKHGFWFGLKKRQNSKNTD